MLIEITGSRCISCAKYRQYYAYYTMRDGEHLQAINCGYCGRLQRTTRPGNRCKHYREQSNVAGFCRSVETKENPRPC